MAQVSAFKFLTTVIIFSCLACALLRAEEPKQEPLWSNGAPLAKGTAKADTPGITYYPAPADKANAASELEIYCARPVQICGIWQLLQSVPWG